MSETAKGSWRPMHSAPRDGSTITLQWRFANGGLQCVDDGVWFHDQWKLRRREGVVVDPPSQWDQPVAWMPRAEWIAINRKTCKTCQFWDQRTDRGGLCRRLSPVLSGPAWPSSESDDWCGEWESAA